VSEITGIIILYGMSSSGTRCCITGYLVPDI